MKAAMTMVAMKVLILQSKRVAMPPLFLYGLDRYGRSSNRPHSASLDKAATAASLAK